MIDPTFDVWVWVAAGLLLVLLGARAVLVETGARRPGRAPRSVSLLTGGCAAALVLLAALLWVQGGSTLVTAVITGNSPTATAPGDGAQVGDPDVDPDAPAGADPLPVDGG